MMIETQQAPAMSVILATPGDFTTIEATVRHLRRQSIAHQLELVIVARTADALSVEGQAFDGFWGRQVVAVGPIVSVGSANAAGVRAARGAIVALAEDHCFPDPGWAEALLEPYARGDVAAVGPVFRNANPDTLVSWCDFVIGYGPWINPDSAGDQAFLPGHNSSYRRSILLSLDTRLEELLGAETVLHFELRSQGHRLVVEPRARTAHANFARFGSWLTVQYHAGRVFGGERARHWSWAKRLFYAAASPLIPCVRFARAIRQLHHAARPRPSAARLGPLLAIGLIADGMGQLVGYVGGAGESLRQLSRFEYRRIDHVPEGDRKIWTNLDSQPRGA